MKRILRKCTATMCSLALLTGVLTGCGGTGSEVSDNTDSNQTSTNSGEKVQIEYWHYFNAESQPIIEGLVEEFNQSQDEIEVVQTYISRADLMKQYTMGALSGELPDVGMVDNPDMASFVEMGVFQDITDEINEWGEVDQFYEGPLASATVDGRYYGLPQNTSCIGIYYNKDLFEAAGLTEDDVPTNWDELYEVSKKLTTEDTFGFAFSAKGTEEGTFTYLPWLYSTGADITTLDSPEAIKSMEYLTRFVEEGITSKEVVNWAQSDVKDAFIAGKAAIMENGSWQMAALDQMVADGTLGFEYGIAYIPKDEKYTSVIGGENIGICEGANKEAAFEFVKFLESKESIAKFSLLAGKFPPRADSMASEEIWSTDENYKVFADTMEFALTRGPHPEWPTISEGIYTALQASLLGEETPEVAMKKAAEKAATVLN